ncbi:MAG: hypothetical protein HC895_26805 [Leptolyngbyaceae cyanobacterium SM1_3_5]|nr:hypothetical protein [Leptolyngbyaceae cyanobacterium SM1_3_5]
MLDKLQAALSRSGQLSSDEYEQLFDEGVDCELLELGDPQWQTGRIRVCLEFIPAQAETSSEASIEPEQTIEFPLDEIRRTLNGANSIDG